MSDEMKEIIAEFVVEAEETLEKVDPLFIELESGGYDGELLNEIFRSMHTIKGAAGFLGLQQIVDVSHKAEGVMKKLRDGELSVSTPTINAILKGVDALKALLRHIRLNDGHKEDIEGVIKELDGVLKESEKSAPAARRHDEPEAAHTEFTQEQVRTFTKEAEGNLRIDVGRIDKVMNLAGEIVLVRNRLLNLAGYFEEKYQSDNQVEDLRQTVSFLDLVTSDMQLAVMKIRMQPLKKVFVRFSRLVRDISHSLGKEVELTVLGEETEVDKTVIERIGDPLVHLIRNAVDHGIEGADERLMLDKPQRGRITVSAYQKGNQIVIEVADDGRGLDIARIKKKAVQRGLISEEEAQRMADESAANIIFLPGFSTLDRATELSGRGVGMDVVKTNIARLNGYVEMMTGKGTGTTCRISIPLTLAIIHALMVRNDGVRYAIPLGPIEETIKVVSGEINSVTGRRVLNIRDRVMPVAELSDILGQEREMGLRHRYVLVFALGERRFCVAVDELLGQEEVVIKSIDGIDLEQTGTLGATITGDGKVVLILDPSSMAQSMFSSTKV